MIICRSPLRITLGGGGTDLPSYYKKNEGFVISSTINKYVYVSVVKPFKKGIFLKYSSLEKVKKVSKINHKIIKEVLKLNNFNSDQIEITTLADIPSGTGLGSSGSFTTALINALCEYNDLKITKKNLAELACKIEIEKLNQPIGKQDQYAAAYGGINKFYFKKNGDVKVESLKIEKKILKKLEKNLQLFFTGYSRNANDILKIQNSNTIINKRTMIENLDEVKQIGLDSLHYLENGDLENFALLMNHHWKIKKERSFNISNNDINNVYDYALKNGAIGGKLIGAGGGGFLMFYSENPKKLSFAMKKKGIQEVDFNFENRGSSNLIL